jgi:16S rRNA G966 N2-methylase RsmD
VQVVAAGGQFRIARDDYRHSLAEALALTKRCYSRKSYRLILADPPFMTCFTSSQVTMLVSPRVL